MPDPPQASPGGVRQPKTMSSRLLTMKFMQRAASLSSPTPSPNPNFPLTHLPPPSKRQRTASAPAFENAANIPETPKSDVELIRQALADEERKREEAVERLQQERGEGKWVFSYVDSPAGGDAGLKVEGVGWGDIDATGGMGMGRRSWGGVNRRMEKRQRQDVGSDNSSSSSNSSEAEGNNSENSETAEVAKAERKVRRMEKKAEATKLAEVRKSKVVNLNKLSAISGGGAGGGGGGGKRDKDVECFRCGETGHRKSECENMRNGKKRKVGNGER